MGLSKRKLRNKRIIKQLCTNFLKYSQVIFVTIDNVSNMQLQKARVALQKSEQPGDIIIAKNSVISKAIKWLTTEPDKASKEYEDHSQWTRRPELKNFNKMIVGNFALIFSDEDYISIKDKIEAEIIQVAAKTGVTSPCDVIIPAGPTNLDVGKVQIFQKLNVQTKAVRNMLEIQKDIHIIKKNERVTPTGSELCRLLGLKPFSYKLEMKKIWLNGTILDEDTININPADILATFQQHCTTLAALSLGAGLPNAASVPHMISNGFKDLLAIGLATGYNFKQLVDAQSGPAQPTASAPAQGGAAGNKAAAVVQDEPEPEEDVSMGGMFD